MEDPREGSYARLGRKMHNGSRGRSNDECLSTEMGGKSAIHGNGHNNMRQSFLSSNEYNSFIERGMNFSPEPVDRSNVVEQNYNSGNPNTTFLQ